MQPPSVSRWQDLHRMRLPDVRQLNQIESRLNLVLLALSAIANLNSEALLEAAKELDLTVSDRSNWWQPSTTERNKPIEVAEARSLVLIISHLAKQHQELIRRAVSLLEQVEAEQRKPVRVTLLNDYINKFVTLYRSKITPPAEANPDLSKLAWKLLTDLLFYSGDNGHRLLWLALFDAAN